MNTEQIKKDFPILENREIAYLDSGATTQKPKQVIKAVEEFYENFSPKTEEERNLEELIKIWENK